MNSSIIVCNFLSNIFYAKVENVFLLRAEDVDFGQMTGRKWIYLYIIGQDKSCCLYTRYSRRNKMEEEERLAAEILELEPKVREFINKGDSSEAIKCQQQILKNKMELARYKKF